jgi:hypothetical protein
VNSDSGAYFPTCARRAAVARAARDRGHLSGADAGYPAAKVRHTGHTLALPLAG